MAEGDGKTVLVTGGSGFLAGWCIVELLRRGYKVRTTIRNPSSRGPCGGIRSVVSGLGKRTEISSEKARTTLGWSPRPVEDSIVETAESLIEHGAAPAPTAA